VIVKQPNPLKISVTGHRSIFKSETQLVNSICRVLKRISRTYEKSEISLYSALAEGSDQLVAESALENKNFRLQVPLPMAIEDYLETFNSEKAIKNFKELLSRAGSIEILPATENPQAAFEALGVYLVKQADILLAVWNGEFNHKKGGTSEVVKLALSSEKLVYWIFCPNEVLDAKNSLLGKRKIGELTELNHISNL